MKIQLPRLDDSTYVDQITTKYAITTFIEGLSHDRKKSFDLIFEYLKYHFPLQGPKSEDKVVEEVSGLLTKCGWKVRDCRSTFVPGTQFKPDLWLDNRDCYAELLKLPKEHDSKAWHDHIVRTTKYARHCSSQVSFCTDGRRWFVAFVKGGDLKVAYFDLKRLFPESDELKTLAVYLMKGGALFDSKSFERIVDLAEIGKAIFKGHILKLVSKLDDTYKSYFGLACVSGYAHYNSSRVLDTSILNDCILALKTEHYDLALELMLKHIRKVKDAQIPGISAIAEQVIPVVGKVIDRDLEILKSALIDEKERPISWENFNSDDLSEVYEALSGRKRKHLGIFTTPREICYEVLKTQIQDIRDKPKKLAIIDPCCGSGSFIDQAVKIVSDMVVPVENYSRQQNKPEKLYFIGQDIEDLGVAISIVNVYVACLRYLWHLTDTEVELSIFTGSTLDRRSRLYEKLGLIRSVRKIFTGNPPYVRSRSRKLKGKTNQGNLLFKILEKITAEAMGSSMAFVLPAHVIGSKESESFDEHAGQYQQHLTRIWYLPERRIFNGVSEKRHVVAFWNEKKKNEKAKVRILTTGNLSVQNIGDLLRLAKESPQLQFEANNVGLYDSQIYANQYIPTELADAFSKLKTLGEFQSCRDITIVQGIQESHPSVPKSDPKTDLGKVIMKHEYKVGDPIFVIASSDIEKLFSTTKRKPTEGENRNLRKHAKSTPTIDRLEYPKSTNRVIFTDRSIGELSEEAFEKDYPHFCAWLKAYKPLLLTDGDRSSGQLNWWQLQRSRDPRPNAAKKPGIDFDKPKILAASFLQRPVWAWTDRSGHVAAGSSFNVISEFPNSKAKTLRHNWVETLSCWLNSMLIREIWFKLLGNCKLRGVDGEVQVGHLYQIPVPNAILRVVEDLNIELIVQELAELYNSCRERASASQLAEIDKICWRLFELSVGIDLGEPWSRDKDTVQFKPTA